MNFLKQFGGLSEKSVDVDELAKLAICENLAAAKDHADESHSTAYTPSGNEAGEWRYAVSQYRLLTSKIDPLEEMLKVFKSKRDKHLNVLKDLMGEASSADHDGIRITRYSAKGPIDYPRLVRDQGLHPAFIESFRKATSIRYRVTLAETDRISRLTA